MLKITHIWEICYQRAGSAKQRLKQEFYGSRIGNFIFFYMKNRKFFHQNESGNRKFGEVLCAEHNVIYIKMWEGKIGT